MRPFDTAANRKSQTGRSLRKCRMSHMRTKPTLPIAFRMAAIGVVKRRQPQLFCQQRYSAITAPYNHLASGQGAPDAAQFKKALTVSSAECGGTSRPGPGSQAQSTNCHGRCDRQLQRDRARLFAPGPGFARKSQRKTFATRPSRRVQAANAVRQEGHGE